MIPAQYDTIRYLAAKKPIDDRALNHNVYRALARHPLLRQKDVRVRIIEVGAGIGTMLERLIDRQLWHKCNYTALDISAANLKAAVNRLTDSAEFKNGSIGRLADGSFAFCNASGTTTVELLQTDVYDYLQRQQGKKIWDVIIAHAFMDLVNIETLLPLFRQILGNGGLMYLTLNFDGETVLLPRIDKKFDRLVTDAYHRTMDARVVAGRPSGDSHTGRHLFEALHRSGATVIQAGSSDWVVHPRGGKYPGEEAYFLHHIIHTMQTALHNPEPLDRDRLSAWLKKRHQQIECGELVYIAKQLDFLAQTA